MTLMTCIHKNDAFLVAVALRINLDENPRHGDNVCFCADRFQTRELARRGIPYSHNVDFPLKPLSRIA